MTNGLAKYETGRWEPAKWDPFEDLWNFRSSLDRFFGERAGAEKRQLGAYLPRIELADKKDHVLVRAEFPGVDRKDIQLTVEDGNLVLKAETKRDETSDKDGTWYSERRYGSFYRSVELPAEVDIAAIKAAYKDGVLSVTLPKTPDAQNKNRKIEIE